MNKGEKSFDQLFNLADTIIENIIETPDKDILSEVKEDHGNPNFEADIMRDIISRAQVDANKMKFQRAKEELEGYKRDDSAIARNIDISKNMDLSDFESLTMAARNGKEISEDDKSGILEDLEELKRMKSWKDKD